MLPLNHYFTAFIVLRQASTSVVVILLKSAHTRKVVEHLFGSTLSIQHPNTWHKCVAPMFMLLCCTWLNCATLAAVFHSCRTDVLPVGLPESICFSVLASAQSFVILLLNCSQ